MLTYENITAITENISYKGWDLITGEMGNGYFIQWKFMAPDAKTGEMALQSCRKWYISPFATKSEVVLTAFKAVSTAEEHETREQFQYKKTALLQPHFDVEQMVAFAKQGHEDARQHIALTN